MGKLTPELRKVLKLQYPEDIILEVRGEIVHFKDTEENWRKLGEGLGLEVFKEKTGNGKWVLYNPKNFKIYSDSHTWVHLQCISEENLELPINCSSCYYMFYNFRFKNKNALKNFDTSNIVTMSGMFYNCKFPEDFSLGNKFDTSNVVDMSYMFDYCSFSEGFSLGNKFNTSNVVDMEGMFSGCASRKGFSLGNKFDTSNVTNMLQMFENCWIPEGFSLGDNFNTSKVESMGCMFSRSKLPVDFSLGAEFDTSNVETMYEMFANCTLSDKFSLGDNFNIDNILNADDMFSHCKLPEGKTVKDFNRDYKQIVEWLKSRKPKSSNKTSNTNFFQ